MDERSRRLRVALVSLHSSPLDQPGRGDSGGMNVYIRTMVERLGLCGVEVDVFTRCAGRPVPEVEPLGPRGRVIQVPAGPRAPVPKQDLPALVPAFVRSVLDRAEGPYDLVHAHYWLSGWAARTARRRWGVPLVASFHTLGRVKNRFPAPGDAPEPPIRIRGEEAVIAEADRVLVPTADEAANLTRLYRTASDRVRVVTPGVDRRRFRPGDGGETRARLGLDGRRVALFVGRLQPHKGPDVAVRAVARAVAADAGAARDLALVLVGADSGSVGQAYALRRLAREGGVEDRVRFLPPVPHDELPGLYAAAEAVLVPSRTESFGLVALEAQACGVPVVASSVGGLRSVVEHGRSGLLVPGHDPERHAEALLRLLRSPGLAAGLSRGGVRHAARFPWERTIEQALAVYEELVEGPAARERAMAVP